MNQKQLLRPVADAAALAAPLANYNTADAVEFLNTLELERAADTLAARVLVQEHRLYPAVLRRFAAGDRSRLDL